MATIEKLVSTGVAWSIIEAATGIDQEAFGRLKHRFESADDASPTGTDAPTMTDEAACAALGESHGLANVRRRSRRA